MMERFCEEKDALLPRRYAYDINVDFHDTDSLGMVRPSAVFRYMQSAANLQMHVCGPSNEKLHEMGQAFVVTRFAVSLNKPLYAYENVRAETWALESRGVSFGRYYRLVRNDELVAEAQSVCALLSRDTGRPLPVSAFEPGFTFDTPPQTPLPLRFRMPHDDAFAEVGNYRVTYGDTDFNRHMNNTRYPDMLADFLPMEGHRFRSVILNFQKEAPLGAVLRILHAEEAGIHYFRTYRPDGTLNIEAAVTLESAKAAFTAE